MIKSTRFIALVLVLFGSGDPSRAQGIENYKLSEFTSLPDDLLEQGDRFGSSLTSLGDLNGDGHEDVAVGAPRRDGGGTDRGAVFVLFRNELGGVVNSVEIGDGAGGFLGALDDFDQFGISLANLGDLDDDGVVDLAVGALRDDDGYQDAGAVWVLFLNGDGTVKAEQKISQTAGGFLGVVPGGKADVGFGRGLTGLGDLDGDGVEDLAVTSLSLVWTLFLDTTGNVLSHQEFGVSNFQKVGGWDSSLNEEMRFGTSIANVGDVNGDGVTDVVVGAPGDDHDCIVFNPIPPCDIGDVGVVWIVFLASDGTVVDEVEVKLPFASIFDPEGLGYQDEFGAAIAPMGDLDEDLVPDFVVGSPGDDGSGSPGFIPPGNTGALWFVFPNADGSVKTQLRVGVEDAGWIGLLDFDDRLGTSLALLEKQGEFPGLAAGAPRDDDGGTDQGALWIVLDGSGPPPPALFPAGELLSQTMISEGEGGFTGDLDEFDYFGGAVCRVGDVDQDGVGDLAVGALLDTDGHLSAGAVWILFLNPDGTVRDQQKISALEGGFPDPLAEGTWFGSAVAPLGDLDGDGTPDLAVGSYGDDDGGGPFDSQLGSVWILFLAADGTVNSAQKINSVSGNFPVVLEGQDWFGRALANLGDLDGDGTVDLAVGAPGDNDDGPGGLGVFDTGAVYVLFLNSDGTVKAHQKIGNTDGGLGLVLGQSDRFGGALSLLGDLSGDGVPELAVGAPDDDDGGPDKGAVYVLSLDADGSVLAQQKISNVTGGFLGAVQSQSRFGTAVAGVGDLDGDGTPDLAAGAPGDDDGGVNGGAVWILGLAPDATAVSFRKLSLEEGGYVSDLRTDRNLGDGLGVVGDLTGDGKSDLAVGVWHTIADGDEVGGIWLFELDGLVQPLATPYGCGVNPPGSLTVIDGEPTVGDVLIAGVDNPLGTQGASVPVLGLALAPAPGYPCGLPLPGWGMTGPGAAGELLLDPLAAFPAPLLGPVWTTPDSPVPIPLAIPDDAGIVGASFWLQAVLWDPVASGGVALGLTNGLRLVLGP